MPGTEVKDGYSQDTDEDLYNGNLDLNKASQDKACQHVLREQSGQGQPPIGSEKNSDSRQYETSYGWNASQESENARIFHHPSLPGTRVNVARQGPNELIQQSIE
jgi:hypothetical protein